MAQIEWETKDNPFNNGQSSALANSKELFNTSLATLNDVINAFGSSTRVSPLDYYKDYESRLSDMAETNAKSQAELIRIIKQKDDALQARYTNVNNARTSNYSSLINKDNVIGYGKTLNDVNPKLRDLFQAKADKYGIPASALYAKAFIESGFNPRASNSSYGGLFANSIKQYGDKVFDPEFATELAAKSIKDSSDWYKQRGVDNASFGHSYLRWQQGDRGALALLNGGDRLAGETLNPFYKGYRKYANLGVQDGYQPVFQNLSGKESDRAKLAKTISSRDFSNYWINRGNATQAYWDKQLANR